MKTVAIFLLLTFSGTILLPVAMTLTQQSQINLFIVDEEKSDNAEQANETKEQKKDFSSYFLLNSLLAARTSLHLLGDDHNCLLPPSPYLEYVAPPPNVC